MHLLSLWLFLLLVRFLDAEKCTENDARDIYLKCSLYYNDMTLWCDKTNFTTIPHPDETTAYAPCSLSNRLFINDSCVQHLDGDKLKEYGRLKQLIGSKNLIEKLTSGTFKHSHKLELIDLSENQIVEIEEKSLQGLESLQELRMKHNKIVQISKPTFEHTRKLRSLSLDRNHFSEVRVEIFTNLPNLQLLSFRHNRIKHWTSCTDSLKSLTVLDLTGNLLSQLKTKDLCNMPALERLHLKDNRIKTVALHAFNKTRNLTEIDLRNNKLRSLPKHVFRHLCHLEKLLLHGNQLHTPHYQWFLNPIRNDEHMKKSLTSLTADNPWKCTGCAAWEYSAFLKHLESHPRNRYEDMKLKLDITCPDDTELLSVRENFNCTFDILMVDSVDLSPSGCKVLPEPKSTAATLQQTVDGGNKAGVMDYKTFIYTSLFLVYFFLPN